ncbi:unnamed protein product [Caenorhabditis auriculariae]|uniref:Uncharacterized protein n=1 Tax=Caenorhabditis auriculariae TaxID=2777116 RepID=A0A8S1GRN9_9PELO|nr:unnamed protein product [Caenorhabditis auriculariae]
MGNAVYTDQMVCHDTLETCKSHCDKSECVFVDKCNNLGQKFICVPFDPRFLFWIIIISFLIVLLTCSSLVACYICRAVRRSYQMQVEYNNSREVVFNNPGRVHHVQYDPPRRCHHGPKH